MVLRDKILQSRSGIITYGITPPKRNNTDEKVRDITQKHIERLEHLEIDGLVVYDIQEEAERTDAERPFPFLPTIDSEKYSREYLGNINVPKIVYRCIGKYSEGQLVNWMKSDSEKERYSVFVGASSSKQKVAMKLDDAYKLHKGIGSSSMILGGVTIPERHTKRNDEHLRIADKSEKGCRFFVSQAVYNLESSKNVLSDYYYYCSQRDIPMAPILITLTPCGSQKTLEFMKWLGINIPKWLENELLHSKDILDKSIEVLRKQFKELLDFALEKRIPLGCNIESVSVRKVEIEASIQLVNEVGSMLRLKI
jgi:hypothetical protein